MKKSVVLLAAVCLVAACTSRETPEVLPSKVFQASIEPATKTYTEGKKVYWYSGDPISVFDRGNAATDNVKYTFAGQTGTTRGPLTSNAAATSSGSLKYTYGIYPYLDDNLVLSEGKSIAYIFPEQDYELDSFGDMANAMVAVSADNQTLEFKNVAGYLKLRLYGDASTAISAVQVTSNNGEYITGDVLVEMLPGEAPVVSAYPDNSYASDKALVSLPTSPETILNPSESSPLDVWFALTPGTVASGITVSVLGADGRVFSYENKKPLTIKRGICTSTAPLKVEFPELNEDPETKAYIEENLAGTYIFNITALYDDHVYDNAITISYSLKAGSNVHLEGDFIDCDLSVDATFDPETGLLSIPYGVAACLLPISSPVVSYLLLVDSAGNIQSAPISFRLTAPHTLTFESSYSIYIAYIQDNTIKAWDAVKSLNSITYQGSGNTSPNPVKRRGPAVKSKIMVPAGRKTISTDLPFDNSTFYR